MIHENNSFRHEDKYVISAEELYVIRARISHILKKDTHVDNMGGYLIRSVYFDDYCNTSFMENENGCEPRYKWRFRSYNNSADRVCLERKNKVYGLISKQSCLVDLDLFKMFMHGERINHDYCRSRLLSSFLNDYDSRLFRKAVIVQYYRFPYVYRIGNVRITFDCNIAWSNQFDYFFDDKMFVHPILPSGQHLLEVKYDEQLPSYVFDVMQLGSLQKTTFSKYYLARLLLV